MERQVPFLACFVGVGKGEEKKEGAGSRNLQEASHEDSTHPKPFRDR